MLKDGDEKGAAQLLQENTFANTSYSADLERALRLVLQYRESGDFRAVGVVREEPSLIARHQFFNDLDRLHYEQGGRGRESQVPAEWDELLRSGHALGVVFMAAGWTEAAVRLMDAEPLPDSAPAWAAYGLTQAIRLNRDGKMALQFADRQPKSDVLELLRGELLLSLQQAAEAERVLQPLAEHASAAGSRAGWLLAIAALERGDAAAAKKWVTGNQLFQTSQLGQETLAKVAILEGDDAQAAAIYTAIEEESVEAKAFSARRAFAAGDWDQAEQVTRDLIQLLPSNMQLRQNLQAIEQARSENVQ